MKLKTTIALISLALLAACHSNKNNPSSASKQTESAPKKASPMNCYRYASTKDTITLKLVHIGEAITGTLVYHLSEKDKNEGTIQGWMDGDILVARYRFISEGISSTRQVAFKLWDGAFIEGYGAVEVQNGDAHFKDINSLKFDESFKLTAFPCQ